MSFDVKKLFDHFYNKNKTLASFIIVLLLSMLVEVFWYEFYKTTNAVEGLQNVVSSNAAKIVDIQKQINIQDEVSRYIVQRSSFNAYIKRKDTEYERQNMINELIASRLGVAEGQLFVLSEFVKESNSCRK
jgi:hypothetical protein